MNPNNAIWAIAAVLAVAALVRLMRSKQAHLSALLQAYTEQQRAFASKRSRTAKIAKGVAKEKVIEERIDAS